jgi:AICAR transformylase/IMP cyclohydrolase PurH
LNIDANSLKAAEEQAKLEKEAGQQQKDQAAKDAEQAAKDAEKAKQDAAAGSECFYCQIPAIAVLTLSRRYRNR